MLSFRSPNLNGAPIHFGGLPSVQYILKRPSQVANEDFTGCMRNIYINGNYLDRSTALKSDRVINGCTKANGCTGSTCKSGKCIDNWKGFQCQCETGYSGDSCSAGMNSHLLNF